MYTCLVYSYRMQKRSSSKENSSDDGPPSKKQKCDNQSTNGKLCTDVPDTQDNTSRPSVGLGVSKPLPMLNRTKYSLVIVSCSSQPPQRCSDCKQFLDDKSITIFVGDPENAVCVCWWGGGRACLCAGVVLDSQP